MIDIFLSCYPLAPNAHPLYCYIMPKKKGDYTQKIQNVYENYQMLTWLLSGWKSSEEGDVTVG